MSDAVGRMIDGFSQRDESFVGQADAVDTDQHYGGLVVSKSDGAGPQWVIHSLRRPVAAESAQPHQVKISVLIAVFKGVTFLRFERAITVVGSAAEPDWPRR